MNRKCENCVFFESQREDAENFWFGECHRRAPQPAQRDEKLTVAVLQILEEISGLDVDFSTDEGSTLGVFPRVENVDWCGEFEADYSEIEEEKPVLRISLEDAKAMGIFKEKARFRTAYGYRLDRWREPNASPKR